MDTTRPGVLHEQLQQHRLEQGEADGLAAGVDLEGPEVDLRLADAGGLGLAAAARAQSRRRSRPFTRARSTGRSKGFGR